MILHQDFSQSKANSFINTGMCFLCNMCNWLLLLQFRTRSSQWGMMKFLCIEKPDKEMELVVFQVFPCLPQWSSVLSHDL